MYAELPAQVKTVRNQLLELIQGMDGLSQGETLMRDMTFYLSTPGNASLLPAQQAEKLAEHPFYGLLPLNDLYNDPYPAREVQGSTPPA